MAPRNWPPSAWVAAGLIVLPLGYDNAVGSYSMATGLALLCGSVLGAARALRIQALVAVVSMPVAAFALATPLAELGYLGGRPLAAFAAAWLAPAEKPMQRRRAVLAILAVMAAAAIPVTSGWREPWAGLGLKTYYSAVILMALLLAIYYSVRLVAYPSRVLAFGAALAPYYMVGVVWALAVPALLGIPTAERALSGDVVFHGFVTHLPADLLSAVVVAFVSGPRHGLRL